jgi:hypothetical protein
MMVFPLKLSAWISKKIAPRTGQLGHEVKVKLSLYLTIKQYAMKTYWGVEV